MCGAQHQGDTGSNENRLAIQGAEKDEHRDEGNRLVYATDDGDAGEEGERWWARTGSSRENEEEVEEAVEEMSIGSTADEVEVREAQEEIHIHTETFFRIEGEDEAPIESF